MIQLARNLFFWALDYAYIIRKQTATFIIRTNPARYRREGAQPVLLIPGIYENWRFMQPVAQVLYDEGYDVHVIDQLGYNRGTVEAMAAVVSSYIKQQKLTHVTIVAHSKGGLIGKYLLSFFKKSVVIDSLITLHTPFGGSKYAYAMPLKSLRIFIPHSAILTALADDIEANAKIISIYGIFDPHIPGGSYLEGARNIQLKTYGHFRIMNSSKVHATILRNIS